jgi:hypothetical protein
MFWKPFENLFIVLVRAKVALIATIGIAGTPFCEYTVGNSNIR